jgi:hypothetical protein
MRVRLLCVRLRVRLDMRRWRRVPVLLPMCRARSVLRLLGMLLLSSMLLRMLGVPMPGFHLLLLLSMPHLLRVMKRIRI